MREGLTQKQKLFCLEYLKDFNATRAYKKVYWVSQKSAEALWCKMLSNIKVNAYISEKAKQKTEKADLWVDFVLNTLNEVIQIWMWKQEVELEDWKTKRVLDLSNVNSALEKLWKYHKMYTDKVEQEGTLNIQIVSYKKWQN